MTAWVGANTTPTCTWVRTLLRTDIPRASGRGLAARARGRGRQAHPPGPRSPTSAAAMALDNPDGASLSGLDVPRHRCHSRSIATAHARASSRRASRTSSSKPPTPRLYRRPLRPDDDVRLPARHGRSGRRGPPRPPGHRRGRHVDDRRTDRRATTSRTTSTRSDAPITDSRRCCALRRRCRSRSGWRWERRPVPPASAMWCRRPASPVSEWPHTRRSTTFSKSGRNAG